MKAAVEAAEDILGTAGTSQGSRGNPRRNNIVQARQLVNVHNGSADLEMILREEREEKHIKRLQEETEERGEILVISKNLYVMSFLNC